ncbi:hypothetical protein PHMEG_0005211 [Phytophthora megakarya]|uniref:Uncharacterized protein n=1 Tax=Phytophthora megakarya TaxID=4795 RepID=A0A225WU01_9STRA|nr:hypothetical protein PHMEG_0005211 [Phytophthora megakarya]
MDFLEYWQMDTEDCTLADGEDAIQYHELFRTKAAFWCHSRKPCVLIPMGPKAHKGFQGQPDILDQHEPARLYWGLPISSSALRLVYDLLSGPRV